MRHLHTWLHTARARLGNKGTTAIEFAFIAPVLMLLIMAIVEFSLVMYVQGIMEAATYNGARLGKTGYVGGASRQAGITSLVDHYAGTLIDINQLTITTQVYGGNWNNVSGGGGTAGQLGNGGDIVVYTVTYPWHLFTPIIQQFIGTNGIYNISSRTVVQNEPF